MSKKIKIIPPGGAFVVTDYVSPSLLKLVERGGWILPSHFTTRAKKFVASITLVFFFAFTILPQALLAAPVIEAQGEGTFDLQTEGNVTNITVAGNMTGTTTNADQIANEIWNVHFKNPTDSFVLNVFDASGTQLMGTINIHNGLFALLNSAGIEVGSTAAINVSGGGFIASALGSLNVDVMNGKYVFKTEDGTNGFVVNNGKITGNDVSFVALLGKAVENNGEIKMPLGKVALAGGDQVTLGISGDNNLISVAVDKEVTSHVFRQDGTQVKDQIKNGVTKDADGNIVSVGTIQADGGQVTMNAQAVKVDAKTLKDVFDHSINLEGHVQANAAVVGADGSIEIVASDDIHIRQGAMIEAINGAVEIESKNGVITNDGTINVAGGELEMNAHGAINTLGTLKAGVLHETAAEFNIGGIYNVGLSYHDNLDNAITYAADTSVSGTISDVANIVINAGVTITLSGDTVFNADSDSNGTGAFTMDSTATIAGQGYNLTLKASDNSTVGIISNVGTLTLARNATDANITFTSSTSVDDIDVNTFYTNTSTASGVTFVKTVGTGADEANARLIYDVTQLQNVQNNLGFYYKLANNINAYETRTWNSNVGFDAIGDGSNPFTGVFDGQGYGISYLRININTATNNATYYNGLFARTNGATINNVSLSELDYDVRHSSLNNTMSYVGGLVGYAVNTDFDNVSTSGAINLFDKGYTGATMGGVVGYIDGGTSTLTNASSSASVRVEGGANRGVSISGGLVGHMGGNVTISKSFATGESYARQPGNSGSLTDTAIAGGLVGYSNGTANRIEKSYATGQVRGFVVDAGGNQDASRVGGFIGEAAGTTRIINSYSTGVVFDDVSSNNADTGGLYVGGFIGLLGSSSSIDNSYSSPVAGGFGFEVKGSSSNVFVGGFVGKNQGVIRNSFTTAIVTKGFGASGGGFAGQNSGGTITNSYFTDSTYDNSIGTLASGANYTARVDALKDISHAVYTTDTDGIVANEIGDVWSLNTGIVADSSIWRGYNGEFAHLRYENYDGDFDGIDLSGSISGLGADTTVSLSINGAAPVQSVASTGGSFSFTNLFLSATDKILIYLDNDGATSANLVGVLQAAFTDVTGINLTVGNVTLGTAAGTLGTAFTNTILSGARYNDPDDLKYTIAGETATFGFNFQLMNGATYTGGSGTTSFGRGLDIKTGATLNLTAGQTTFDGISSTLNMDGTANFNDVLFDAAGTTWTVQDTMNIAGDLIVDNGTLSAASSTMNFTGSGNIESNGSTLGVVNVTGTYALNDALTASGELTVATGTLDANSRAISEGGDWTANQWTNITERGNVTLTGSNKNITSSGNSFGALNISGSYTAQDHLSVLNGLTNSGTLAIADKNLAVTNGFTNTGTLKLDGSAAQTISGVSVSSSQGTIEYTGAGVYSELKLGDTYNHLTISGAGTYTLDNNLTTNGNLTVSGNMNAANFDISTAGNWNVTGSVTNLDLVTLTGTGKTIVATGNTFNDLTVTGTYTANSAMTVSDDFLLSSGSLDTSTRAFTVGGDADIRGGSLYSTSGAKTFNGGLNILGGNVYVGSSSNFNVNGDLILADGDLNGNNGTINLSGHWLRNGGTFTRESSTVNFNGAGLQTVLGGDGFYNLSHTGTGTLQAASTLTAYNNFSQTAGTLDTNGFGMSLIGTADFSGGTVSALAGSNYFGGLILRNGVSMDAAGANVTVGDSGLDIRDTAFLRAPGSGKTFALSGNFSTDIAGNFDANGGTLTLNGSNQTINGSNTFYNFIKQVTSASTLTFEAGTTQTVQGALTLNGAAGSELSLRSSVDGQTWSINPEGSASLSYLNIKDGANTSGTNITAVNSTNSGHNSGWLFPVSSLFIWLGSVSTDWANAANWNIGGLLPGVADDVVISSAGFQPVLSGSVSVNNLTINSSATLNLNGFGLSVGGVLSNSGTVTLQGNETVTLVNGNDTNSGNWNYVGDGTNGNIRIKDFGSTDYSHLTLNSASGNSFDLGANLVVGGTMTLSGNNQVSFGTYNVNSGTTNLSNGSINAGSGTHVLGTWTISGGADYVAQTSSVRAASLTMTDAGSTYTGGTGTLDINGDLSIGAGTTLTAPSSTLYLSGNFSNSGTFTHNSGSVVLDGTSQTITGNNSFNNLSKQTASGTLTFTAGTTQNIAGALVLKGTSGNLMTLQSSSSGTRWTINPTGTTDVAFVQVRDSNDMGGVINAASSVDLGNNLGGWAFGARLLTWLGLSTDWFDAANWDLNDAPDAEDSVVIENTAFDPLLTSAITINNLQIKSGAVLVLNGQGLTVSGVLDNSGTIQLQGAETISLANGNDIDSGTWEYLGDGTNGAITIKDFGTSDYYNLILNSAANNDFRLGANLSVAGTLTMSGMDEFDSNGFTVNASAGALSDGTYLAAAAAQTFSSFTVSGTGVLEAGAGTMSVANDIELLSGSELRLASGNLDINGDLFIYDGVTINGGASGTVDILGDIVQVGGTFTAPTTLRVGGDWIMSGNSTFNNNNGSVVFYGSGTHTLLSDGNAFNDLSQTGTGTLQLSDALTASSLTIGSGATADLNGQNLTLSGASFSNSGTLQLQGAETLVGFTNDTDSGTVEYTGSGTYNDLIAGDTYSGLTISGTGTFNPNAAMDVNGAFNQTGGTFTAPTSITVGSNFILGNDATFAHNNGLVTLDSANTAIVDASDGDFSFWDFSIIAPVKTVQFRAGETFRVLSPHTWVVQGGGLGLTLQSTVAGQAWNIAVADNVGGVNLNGFVVYDSNNISGGGDISCPTCYNGGGNIGWTDLLTLPGSEPSASVDFQCPGPSCPDNIEIEGEEKDEAFDLNHLIDTGAEAECLESTDASLNNPNCAGKSSAEVSSKNSSVYTYSTKGDGKLEAIVDQGVPREILNSTAQDEADAFYSEMIAKLKETELAKQTPEQTGRYAKIQEVKGDVFIKQPSGDWAKATTGTVIREMDEVRTGEDASAKIVMDGNQEGGVVLMTEKSLVRPTLLQKDPVNAAKKVTLLEVAFGRVSVQMGDFKGQSQFVVRTPSGVSGMRE